MMPPYRKSAISLFRVVLVWLLSITACYSRVATFGIDLSLGYGAAAVYFENGTFVTVAKIQGSPEYGAAMQHITYIAKENNPSNHSEQVTPIHQDFWSADIMASASLIGDHSNTLRLMLHSLKVSLEAYMMSTGVFDAVISVPTKLSDEHSFDLKQIAQNSGLLVSGPFSPRASYDLVAESLFNTSFLSGCGLDPLCEPTEVVLVINFSEAVLSLALFFIDDGVIQPVRSLMSQELGLGSIESSPHPETGWNRMAQLLEHAASPVSEEDLRRIGESSGAGPRAVQKVIVVGDRAGEPRLWMMIQALFESEIVDRVRDAISNRHLDWTASSGALGAARTARKWLDS